MSKNVKIVLLEIRKSITIYKFTLGLDYLTSVLREAGYQVWNYIFEEDNTDTILDKIVSVQPDLVGISFYRENEDSIFELTRKLKIVNKQIKIFLGGHTATLHTGALLKREKSIDIVINGEGEETLLELCDLIENDEGLENCEGISYRVNDKIIRNSNRKLIKDLDQLPFPALDGIFEKSQKSNYVFPGISTSRGCMGSCAFCVANRYYKGKKVEGWRGRSPQNIVDEIKHLIRSFSDKRIFYMIVDSSIEDPDPEEKLRLKELVRLLKAENIKIPFTCFTRAESWSEKDWELILDLKSVGLYEVSIGYESSKTETLELFNKRATSKDNYMAYNLFKRSDINVFGFLIMFHPYTTLDELKQNASMLLEVGMAYHPQSWWQTLDLWPDTRLFTDVVRDGLLIGPEEKGYLYEYAYANGNIERINHILRKIGTSTSSMSYANTNEKIKLEILLYDVWKDEDKMLQLIDDSMNRYKELYEQVKSELGKKQYDLFIKLIESVETNKSDQSITELGDRWEELLDSGFMQLEKIWMKFYMEFRRKKVQILS